MANVSTIYVNNLNEKIKIDVLKKSLTAVFSQFGDIVEIIASKKLKMRGQAFVVFKDHSAANAAVQSMNGFNFYNKALKVQLAKKDSDVCAKQKGTYVEKPRTLKPKVKQIKDSKNSLKNVPISSFSNIPISVPNVIPSYPVPSSNNMTVESYPVQNMEQPPPNNILFVTNLPEDGSEKMLNLFRMYRGFKEIRPVLASGIAFVEYENEEQAGKVKNILQGFQLTPTHFISISYANKGSLTSDVDKL